LIPKDIVMLEFVWYFRTWADTEDLLLRNGFQVIFGNCYSSHFPRYERRTSKEGVIGTQVSVWSGTNEEDMGRLGKLYDLIYSANTAWSATCHDELRWTFDRKIADLLPAIRSRLRGLRSAGCMPGHTLVPINVQAHFTMPRCDPTGAQGGYDLSGLPTGEVVLRDVPFDLGNGVLLVEAPSIRDRQYPDQVTIPIGAKAAALVLAHTCTTMGPIAQSIGPRQPIAQYEICYADGTAEIIPVAFGYHVAEWNRRHGAPLGHRFHRHAGYVATYPVDPLWQGKTALGEDVTLYGLEWTNPHPERVVESICVEAVENGTNASLIVAGITLVRA
jgi:hypothetical protein